MTPLICRRSQGIETEAPVRRRCDLDSPEQRVALGGLVCLEQGTRDGFTFRVAHSSVEHRASTKGQLDEVGTARNEGCVQVGRGKAWSLRPDPCRAWWNALGVEAAIVARPQAQCWETETRAIIR